MISLLVAITYYVSESKDHATIRSQECWGDDVKPTKCTLIFPEHLLAMSPPHGPSDSLTAYKQHVYGSIGHSDRLILSDS